MTSSDITSLIPHRDPFLWIDDIITLEETEVITEKYISEDLDFFKGHYPDNPIVPGVILCEAVFQSGALLMGHILKTSKTQGVPVLTRIENAKFKQLVRPGDTITMKVTLQETLSNVSFFKGKVLVNNKVAVAVNFACAIAQA